MKGVVKDNEFVDRTKNSQAKIPSITMDDNIGNKIETIPAEPRGLQRMETKVRDGEDYGVHLDKIEYKQSGQFHFKDESKEDGRLMVYSSNETVIGDSKWKEFHKSIKGDFYDAEFDCLNQFGKSKDKIDPMFGLRRCTDEYDQNKM